VAQNAAAGRGEIFPTKTVRSFFVSYTPCSFPISELSDMLVLSNFKNTVVTLSGETFSVTQGISGILKQHGVGFFGQGPR
jgi:hypothetical protein